MEERSNIKNPERDYSVRTGSGKAGGVLLGIGALLAAGVAGYAVWTLTKAPAGPDAGQEIPVEQGAGGLGAGGLDGIAPTESIEEILGAVQVYVRNQEYAQATTVLEHAARQFPGDQEIHLALGDLYMVQKKHEPAYAQYVSGIEIGPSSSTMEFTAGTLAQMLGRTELAEMHYMAAMRLDPKNPDMPIYLAAVQMKANRLDDAKMNLAIAGKLAPDRSTIYAMRSDIALRENKLHIALEQIQKAIDLSPREAGLILQQAKVLKRMGKGEEALNLLASLPEEQLSEPDTARLLAECYGLVGRPGDAASRMMDVASLHPQDGQLAFDVALWLERAGEREQAIEWANKAQGLGHGRAGDWIASLP